MRLRILGSNSQGNCYILENDQEALIIECGVRFQWIKQALDFNLAKVVGCLVTHEHKDHCMSVSDVLRAGINVYASAGTIHAMHPDFHHRLTALEEQKRVKVGGFRVMGFRVQHDAEEPFGFLIQHPETGNVLFLTDTYYTRYTFKNLHNIIIEANYCQQILDERITRGASPQILRDRVLQSHMSIDTCKQTLAANDLTQVNNIVLIHLSDGNSDAIRFKKEVQEATGKRVHVAQGGMIIQSFNKTPF